MIFPAHIRIHGSEIEVQTLQEHSQNAAVYAERCLKGAGLKTAAKLAALVHDCGKFKQEFAEYLYDPDGIRGSVNHTFAGVRLLLERYHAEDRNPRERLTAELLAYAVGAHHGLFDCVDENGHSGFVHRQEKTDIHYEESKRNFLSQCADASKLDEYFQKAHTELNLVYEKLTALTDDPEEMVFLLGMLARLLLSAVIDGDRRDTAEFISGIVYPYEPEDPTVFWKTYLSRMEQKLVEFPKNTQLQKMRGVISDQCRAFAEKPGGIYRLNVPTGAGKTLSALRYALAHAQKWGKQRLIFTLPLLSILEQNAEVLRTFLGVDNIILEHHSNAVQPGEGPELDLRELAVETWNAPVIITTLVQLLNTLFEGRTTAIRRMQGLCNSVIVIDEVQTVPHKMLSLFNLAMDFLTEVCGATVLLCSATQPCLERAAHPLRRCAGDLIPYNEEIWEPFRRTVITDAGCGTMEEITRFCRDTMEGVDSLLVVCNRKDEAEYLFHALKDDAFVCFHLSASMCTAHRRNTLKKLNEALAQSQRCLCVATQVIEAGVDISFQRVIRLTAGMDSVIQAAGRCNRHGEFDEPVPVYLISCQGEKLGMLREIKEAKDATVSLLDAYRRDPARFDNDLSSNQAINWYYRKLYSNAKAGYQDFYIKEQHVTLLDLLACNDKFVDGTAAYTQEYCMSQAFKLAGKLFQVFDNNTRDLVVPYGEGSALILELIGKTQFDLAFLADWERRARPYTVAAYDWQLRQLGNAVTEYCGVAVLSDGYYDEATGLRLGPKETEFLEV